MCVFIFLLLNCLTFLHLLDVRWLSLKQCEILSAFQKIMFVLYSWPLLSIFLLRCKPT